MSRPLPPEEPYGVTDETVVERPPPGPPPPEEIERNLWPWLGALLLIIAAGILAWWLISRDNGPNRRTVPRVVGMTQSTAIAKVRNAGFAVLVKNRFSSGARGTVIAQAPDAGTRLAKGRQVTIEVSQGQRAIAVPNLISLSQDDAVAQLTKAGLNPDVVLVPSSSPQGEVIAQNPVAGRQVDPGTTVRLNVSKGRAQVTTVTNTVTTTRTQTTTQTQTSPAPPPPPPVTTTPTVTTVP